MDNTVRCIGMDWKNKGKEEIYQFPENWKITEYKLKNINKLDDETIIRLISGEFPFQDKKTDLREISKGKNNVVILIDDLSRFTPSYQIVPMVIQQLLLSNVKKENISFIIAVGSHKQLSKDEMAFKLGKEILDNYAVENHDCMSDQVEFFGNNSYGTPVKINRKVAEADLVIGIGSLNKHRFAYGSGGSKIILPGVAHIDSIRHNHTFQADDTTSKKERFGKLRAGINEAGRLLSNRTDVILIDVVLNTKREITNLFIGDCVDVFTENIDQIFKDYMVEFNSRIYGRNRKADIGVFRVDTLDPLQIGKAISNWPSVCNLPIVVGDFSETHIYQGLTCGTYDEYLNKHQNTVYDAKITLQEAIDKKKILICSENLDKKSARMWTHGYYVTDNWEGLVETLSHVLGQNRTVAFFHDAYFQIINVRVKAAFIKNAALRKMIRSVLSFMKQNMDKQNKAISL